MSLFTELFRFAGSIEIILFTLVLYFLSILSKRLGEVMGMKKYYYLYYIGMFFMLLGSIIMTLSFENFQKTHLVGNVFFATGITFGLIAAIKYWGWLIKELVKKSYS
ncbi:MAG: hypothetical protein O8C64_11660 [Candidatus Methanoperedens sp.]|nr:hypothetical protein [Candidatus Methanoperedens sp.]MCZ7404348.1 hypothetical protein [Candidatus Methanoperedens sp.]